MARQKYNLLEMIDEVHANSVTPEQFKEVWGVSKEEHMQKMKEFVMKFDAAQAAKADK